jgi:two-component system, sensor histidine kinase LadS
MHAAWRRTCRAFCLVLAAWLASGGAFASEVLRLDARTPEVSLTPYVTHYRDATTNDDVATAFRRLSQGQFAPLPDGRTAFGFQPAAYWFYARLRNEARDEPRWLLLQDYALSDHVDVYLRYPDGSIRHQAGGDSQPFEARGIRYRHPNFFLALPPGQDVDLLVRVQSQSSMQVPLSLYTPAAFAELSRDAQLAVGIYYGILLALFVYNLVLWLSLRDASYGWYLLHIGAFGLVLFTLNGFGFEYLWPDSPWLADKSVPLSICLALVGMQQFARIFLELPTRFPRGNWVSLALIGFFALFGIASLWLPYSVATPIATRAVLLGVLWIFIATVVVLRRGYTPAWLFLLAWSSFLVGTTIFSLLAFGLFPKNFLTEYGVQIGSALEMLLLSVALGYRYARLRNENERIVGEANVRLEKQVAERTQELRGALAQLEDAHGKLSESSRRDGLTGLYNRTHFRDAFERMLRDDQGAGRPTTLLMIDLDHFKAINDQHGHLVGDDCLRWAARRIGDTLRTRRALLARFGGEEFIVALGDCGLERAVAVAEELRAALQNAPCEARGRSIRMSASIGVHRLLPADDLASSIDAALQAADEALYSAKAGGRDQVRTSVPA